MALFGIRVGSHMKNYGLPKKVVKIGLNQWQNCVVALGKLAGIIDFPVPPNSSMRKSGGSDIRSYYMGGLKISLPITAVAIREGVRLDQKIRVLDFGCGVGRPLLHITREYPAPSYYACDIDDSAIAFIRKNYPQVQASVTRFSPPLPYETGFFDLVYSVSIFSHLNKEDHEIWLKELARVTKPGGWCFLTTLGYCCLAFHARGLGTQEASLRPRLEKDGFFFQEYDDWRENTRHQNTLKVTSLMVGVERSYGVTMITPEYIRKHWPAAGFEVRAVAEGIAHGQDLAVLGRL